MLISEQLQHVGSSNTSWFTAFHASCPTTRPLGICRARSANIFTDFFTPIAAFRATFVLFTAIRAREVIRRKSSQRPWLTPHAGERSVQTCEAWVDFLRHKPLFGMQGLQKHLLLNCFGIALGYNQAILCFPLTSLPSASLPCSAEN